MINFFKNKKDNFFQIIFRFFEKKILSGLDYIKKSKNSIYFIILLFFFFSLLGFFVKFPEEIISYILNYFRELLEETRDFNLIEMILFLFSNNSFASFLGLFSGMAFGIFPLFNGVTNGIVLGFASNLSVSQNGIFSLLNLIPHGIFELPALFISLGIGLELGREFIKNYFKINKINYQLILIFCIFSLFSFLIFFFFSFFSKIFIFLVFILLILFNYYFFRNKNLVLELRKAVDVFIFIVIPLLMVAAIIEGLLIII